MNFLETKARHLAQLRRCGVEENSSLYVFAEAQFDFMGELIGLPDKIHSETDKSIVALTRIVEPLIQKIIDLERTVKSLGPVVTAAKTAIDSAVPVLKNVPQYIKVQIDEVQLRDEISAVVSQIIADLVEDGTLPRMVVQKFEAGADQLIRSSQRMISVSNAIETYLPIFKLFAKHLRDWETTTWFVVIVLMLAVFIGFILGEAYMAMPPAH